MHPLCEPAFWRPAASSDDASRIPMRGAPPRVAIECSSLRQTALETLRSCTEAHRPLCLHPLEPSGSNQMSTERDATAEIAFSNVSPLPLAARRPPRAPVGNGRSRKEGEGGEGARDRRRKRLLSDQCSSEREESRGVWKGGKMRCMETR